MSPNTACSVTGRLQCYILQGIICSYLYANSLSFLKIISKYVCFGEIFPICRIVEVNLILNLIGISLFPFFFYFKPCIFNFVNKVEKIKDISVYRWISWTIFQTACVLSFVLYDQYLNSYFKPCNSFQLVLVRILVYVYFLWSNF